MGSSFGIIERIFGQKVFPSGKSIERLAQQGIKLKWRGRTFWHYDLLSNGHLSFALKPYASQEEINTALKLLEILGSWRTTYLSRKVKLEDEEIDFGKMVDVIKSNKLKIESYKDLIRSGLITKGIEEKIEGKEPLDLVFQPENSSEELNVIIIESTKMPYGQIILYVEQNLNENDFATYQRLFNLTKSFVEKNRGLNLYKELTLFKIVPDEENPVEYKFKKPLNLKEFLEYSSQVNYIHRKVEEK